MSFAYLRREVISPGLCTRCGSCVGICPKQAVTFSDPLGDCIPIADDRACLDCDAPCLDACPGKQVDFPQLNLKVFGNPPVDYLFGHAPEFFVGHAVDQNTRSRAASGGVITAILKHLLETKEVDGVACLIDDPLRPLQPRPVIATTWETLKLSQQSKYSLAPVNTILRETEQFDGKLAYVALPDQVQSVRMLQLANHPSTRNIALLLGSFCGAVNHFDSVKDFLGKHGVQDLDQVVRIEYRAGNWPGKLRVTLKDGSQLELKKFYANYMNLFYVVERSLYCVDLSNELADISFGDAWAPRYEDRHEGFSLVIGRTEKGRTVLSTCQSDGIINLMPTTRDDALQMHSHGLFNKKVAVWSRIDFRTKLGKSVPNYGYRAVLSLRSRIVGFGIALIYAMAQVPLSRRIALLMPLGLTGRIFTAVRKYWRGKTRAKQGSAVDAYTVNIVSRDE